MARLAVRQTEMMAKTAGPRIPYSLYKGEVGLAVLVAELEHPESSAMPFFDEAWPTYVDRTASQGLRQGGSKVSV